MARIPELLVAEFGEMMFAIRRVSEFVENQIQKTVDYDCVDKDERPSHLELFYN